MIRQITGPDGSFSFVHDTAGVVLSIESDGSVKIKSGALSATPGTVAASKAVVVDDNKDIGDFRNVKLLGLDFELGATDVTLRVVAGKIIVSNLPTIDPATAGALWNDSGTLKLSVVP